MSYSMKEAGRIEIDGREVRKNWSCIQKRASLRAAAEYTPRRQWEQGARVTWEAWWQRFLSSSWPSSCLPALCLFCYLCRRFLGVFRIYCPCQHKSFSWGILPGSVSGDQPQFSRQKLLSAAVSLQEGTKAVVCKYIFCWRKCHDSVHRGCSLSVDVWKTLFWRYRNKGAVTEGWFLFFYTSWHCSKPYFSSQKVETSVKSFWNI